MITVHELTVYDIPENRAFTHILDPTKGFQVYKRKEFVEVVYRNEARKEYSATCYPWHTVVKLSSYGKLERPRN